MPESKKQINIHAPAISVANEGTQGNLAGKNVGRQQSIINNNYAPEQRQILADAAQEIQAILEQLDKFYDINTNTGKMALTLEAVQRIESNPTLAKRILSALATGSVKAFEQFLNHPAASFVIGALEDWEKTKEHPTTQ
ncbi:MAG: hypothetical protein RID53_27760 [Coleofasciculus sp. B1-GNL1-01]|uniref:hypothetical protein n=1 Tax=Coleofasciculus sp. B1-GNL1-01 TaxID=3068484 RepID=UPI00330396BF